MANQYPSQGKFLPDSVVRIVSPIDDPEWDDRLATFPDASFFHGAGWAHVLKDTYGFQSAFFQSGDNCSPTALLPICEIDSWLTGRRGVSLPFSDECTPLSLAACEFKKVYSAAFAHAKLRRWKYIECRGGRMLFGDVPSSTSFYGHSLKLTGGESHLFSDINASVRRAVRKSEQSGLTTSISRDLDAVGEFYRLLCLTRRRHGMPVQPFSFFANIQKHVLARKKGMVVLTKQGGVSVAGAMFFHFKGKALYKFGASDERQQHLRGNNLVMWEAIKWHACHGFSELDFGRTSLGNVGLRKFKNGWGATERLVDYVRYDFGAKRYVVVNDSAAGWHNHVFRRLPIFFSRIVGRVLYRHVA